MTTTERDAKGEAMSDIVERLKSRAAPLTRARELSPTAALCREAAVEIERLRARSSAGIDHTPAAVIRLLTKITNLVDDEDACEPLDDAIRYANEAIAIINDLAQPPQEQK